MDEEVINKLIKQISDTTAARLSKEMEDKFVKVDEFKKAFETLRTAGVGTAQNETVENESKFWKALANGEVIRATGDITNTTDSETMVPKTVAKRIIDAINENSFVRQIATVFPDSKGVLFVQNTGATAHRTAEQAEPTLSTMNVRGVEYTSYEAIAATLVSNKLLKKAAPNLRTYVYNQLGQAFGNLEMYEFIKGSISNHEFEGLYNNTDIPIVTAATGHTSLASIDYDDLIDVYMAVPSQVQARGVWVVSTDFVKAIYKLKDNDGIPIFNPMARTIFNRPYYTTSHLDTSGATNPVAYFGNFKIGYYIMDEGNLTFMTTNQGKELVSTRQTFIMALADNTARVVVPNAIVGFKLAAS